MLDLRVWPAVCAAPRDQPPTIPSDDPALANEDTRTVETTGYLLAEMVFAQDGGNRYMRLRCSLVRLAQTRACVQVVERDRELAAQHVREGYVSLVGDIWIATTRALSAEQLRRVQLETDRPRSGSDRAVMELLLRTGVRIGAAGELEVNGVRLIQRTGEAVVRHGRATAVGWFR